MKKSPALINHQRDLNFIALAFIVFIVICGVLLAHEIVADTGSDYTKPEEVSPLRPLGTSSLVLFSDHEHTLIRPMILADITSESTEYLSLKGRLLQTISDFERKGAITGASIYLKRLSDGSWMNINGNETYLPGSLIKVAIMLYYLKQEELHPGTLEQEFYCKKPLREFPRQEFDEPTLKPGRNYRVSELIRSMIVSSDNLATNILSQHLDGSVFHKMFTDLGIPPDDINDLEYVISPKEYSKFLRVLYNASYVNEKLSEYGLTLMTQSKFREGMAKQLPAGLVIARKFGERGVNNNMDFSEAGIVYDHNDPYILTIMTRGSNMKEQAKVISQLSIEVYSSLSKD